MNIKLNIIELLNKFEDKSYSNILLDEYFKSTNLNNSSKGLVTEIFYGIIRQKIFIDYIISQYTKKVKKKWLLNNFRIAIYQMLFMSSKNEVVIWEAVELTKEKYDKVIGNFVNGVLRNILREKEKIIDSLEKKHRYDILYSYPTWIYAKIKSQYKKNYLEILKKFKEIPITSFKVNKLKSTIEEFEKYIFSNSMNIYFHFGDIYYLKNKLIYDSDLIKEKKVTIQDGASYSVAKILEVNENERVLDVCAAPGGKTLVMAECMNNKGEIIACDINKNRLDLMEKNLKKIGVKNTNFLCCDAKYIDKLEGEFDKILLDVPCSGFGVIRKKPEILYNRSEKDISELNILQYKLIKSAAKKIKKGGTILYSTCTFLKEENTDIIKKFLIENIDFKVDTNFRIDENIILEKDEVGGFYISHKNKYLDGFYFAKIIKIKG